MDRALRIGIVAAILYTVVVSVWYHQLRGSSDAHLDRFNLLMFHVSQGTAGPDVNGQVAAIRSDWPNAADFRANAVLYGLSGLGVYIAVLLIVTIIKKRPA